VGLRDRPRALRSSGRSAVAAGPILAPQLPLPGPGDTRPGPGEAKADAGSGDDLDEPGTAAGQVLGHPVVQVLGPAGVVAGVLVALVEMELVHGAQRMPPSS
jgi:hypothetical protein